MAKNLKARLEVKKAGFSQLGDILREAGIKPSEVAENPSVPTAEFIETDDELFSRAMEGVLRARWRRGPLMSSSLPQHPEGAPELEELRLMQAAVQEDPLYSISEHPEYIEGWVAVDGKRFLPKLRSGVFSIQAQIDLHGLTRAEARRTIEEFIVSMSRFRSCCVKIIHGRGINSPNDTAVLKANLHRWLSTRRMSRHVVAYGSAPARDGGVGAIYVLLRHLGAQKKARSPRNRQ